MHGPTPGA